METNLKPVRLCMVRSDLDAIPEFSLPAGVAVRDYVPGDERHWVDLHRDAAPEYRADEAIFWKYFEHNTEALKRRQLFLVTDTRRVVGTLTAWDGVHADEPGWGRIHFVAVASAWQGRGLARALMTLGCRRLRELGHDRAYLVTDSARAGAIRLYARFGFLPHVHEDGERDAWERLDVGLAGVASDAPTAKVE